MTKKRVSIKDIAAAAGVSHPTVSRALRGEGRISDSTRSRIAAIARRMGYTPNLVARGLVTQRTRSVGLIVTDIGDPFHSEIIRGVERVARQNGYSLFLGSATVGPDAQPEQEVELVRGFHGRDVDGIIVSSSKVGDAYADLLDDLNIPIVLINSHARGDNIHSVSHDDFGGARSVVDHLLDEGHRRIAFLGHQHHGRVHEERRRAWQTSLERRRLPAAVSLDAEEPTIADGFRSVQTLLKRSRQIWQTPPDAIFCYNDLLAIGAISGLRRQGLKVPDDVGVAGFDDLDVAAHLDPSLTTLHQPRNRMGVKAITILLDLLQGDLLQGNEGEDNAVPAPPRAAQLSGELIVRQSSRKG